MFVSLMVLALSALDDPQAVIATARPASSPPLTAEAPVRSDGAGPQTTLDSATPHNLTTDQQISRWVSQRQTGEPAFPEAVRPADDRRMRGEITAGVGTGGYRDVGVWMSLPLGQSARLDVSYDRTENPPFSYYGDPRGPNRFDDDPHGFLYLRDGAVRDRPMRGYPWGLRDSAHRGPGRASSSLNLD